MAHPPRVAIVGAGFAGAATAYHLARAGAPVTLVERETIAGAHASSQNAGILRTCISDEVLARATAAGARGAAEVACPDGPLVRACGALLVADGAAVGSLQRAFHGCGAARRAARWLDPAEAVRRVPLLAGACLDAAMLAEEDGVVDVAGYLAALLRGAREAGAIVRLGVEALAADRAAGCAAGIRTTAGTIAADVVVVAAGAWSDVVAERLGAAPLGLVPHRRHIHVTGPIRGVDPAWPFVWSVGEEVYFRPESGGLLLSPCDEEPFAPCEPPADPASRELLAAKVARAFPGLADLPVMRSWAGLRTFPNDRRFVVGWDPGVPHMFWVAGLGGHGVTSAWEVGRAAARAILGEEPVPAAFAPSRLRAPMQPG